MMQQGRALSLWQAGCKQKSKPIADAGGLLLPASTPGQHGSNVCLQEEAGAGHHWEGNCSLKLLTSKAQQARFYANA